jgi:GNAT superfamily N-acetyltransferase
MGGIIAEMKQIPNLSIRPAGNPDVEGLAALCTQLGYPSTPEQIGQRLVTLQSCSDESTIFVAEWEGHVVGWVHMHVYHLLMDDPEVEIGGLVVDEKVRGNGIGEMLMQTAEAWAIEQGCSSVYLRSNTIREAAHRFYEGIGYRIIKSQYAMRKILK